MLHFVYKTTNLINQKFYVGVHSSKAIDDEYMGSGRTLNRAIAKYGKENFKREILLFCESSAEAYDIESVLICEKLIRRVDVYNEKPGGKGNTKGLVYRKHSITGEIKLFEKDNVPADYETLKHSEEAKERMSRQKTEFYKNLDPVRRKEMSQLSKHSPEKYVEIGNKQRGIPRRPRTEDEKDKTSKSLRIFWDALTEEERKAMGRAQSEETKRKISEGSKKPKEKTECPHCGKIGGVGALKRYHFDNCKNRK